MDIRLCRNCGNEFKARVWCQYYCESCNIVAKKDEYKKLKLSIGCQRCGYRKSANALEFHHILQDKDYGTDWYSYYQDQDKFREEIKKCKLLCANCHREIHEYNLEV